MGRTRVGVLASGRGTDFQSLVDARKRGDLDIDLAVLVCNVPGAPVHEDDTEDSLAARILEQEHIFLPLAVRLFAEGRLHVEGRRVRIDTRGIEIPPMA